MDNNIKKLFSIKNKIVLVAGGSGQIGFSFCEILSRAGAKVVILDLDIELAQKKSLKYKNTEFYKNFFFYKIDVTKKNDISNLLDLVIKKFKKIDALVNSFHYKGNSRKLDTNTSFFQDFENYPEEAWDKVHDVNLKGAFLLTQCILPHMKKNKKGAIVNISSTYGNVSPNPTIYGNSGINSPIAYATSKSAIINLTRYLAVHLAKYNIRVNCLSPGGVYNNQSKEFVMNYIDKTPIGRMAKPEDYQGAILFLLTEASSYMTGANLIIDGGWTAW
jgi:NAD(P)-dependent dehydrogenase (short-subunit alcohol dehydrogenase family)